jgi:hypothetical protein
MTKILFSLFAVLFLLSHSAFACKPAPLPECAKRTMTLKPEKIAGLVMQVEDYQKLLDAHIETPAKTTSCFNNHFSTHFLNLLKEELKANKDMTCNDQIVRVRTTILGLIDPESIENLHVFDKKAKKLLKKNAKKIKIGLMILP